MFCCRNRQEGLIRERAGREQRKGIQWGLWENILNSQRKYLKGGQRKRNLRRRGRRRDWRGRERSWTAHYQRSEGERLLQGGRSSQEIPKLQTSPWISLLSGVVEIPFKDVFDELGKGNFKEVAEAEVSLKWVKERRKRENGIMKVECSQEIWSWMKDGSFLERSMGFKESFVVLF